MRTHTLARGSALAGLAAASATVAHGGTAALATPAWWLPALVAAVAGTAALMRMTGLGAPGAAGRRHGCARGAPAPTVHGPLGLAETTAIMLSAQGCAHLALLAAGASAHPGQLGAARAALCARPARRGGSCGRPIARSRGRSADLDAAVAAARELLLAVLAPAHRPPAGAPAGYLALGRPPRPRAARRPPDPAAPGACPRRPRSGGFALNMRVRALAISVLLLPAAFPAAAQAHASLLRTDPAAGTEVAHAPAQIVLHFDQPVSDAGTTAVSSSGASVLARPRPSLAGTTPAR